MRRPALYLCALAWALAACGDGADRSTSTLRVFAASSMTDVLPEVAAHVERTNDVRVELNFGGSSTLREQILDGAGADVFISANGEVMQDIVDADLTTERPTQFAETSMTIAVPVGNPAGITGLTDFADGGLTLGLCAPEVPCGRLADEVLAEQNVSAAVDTREPNVRALLAKVELGELDAALVYRTDVLASDRAEEVGLAQGTGGRAVYSAIPLDDDGSRDDDFVIALRSPTVRALLDDAGFETS